MSTKQENSVTLARQDAEAESRIARLKAELEAIRCSREALHQEIRNRADIQSDLLIAKRRSPLGIGLAVASICGFAAGLFVFILSDDPSMPAEPAAAAVSWKPETPAVVPNNQVSPAPEAVQKISPSIGSPDPSEKKKPAPIKSIRKRPKPLRNKGKKPPKEKKDGFDFFDKCGNDPMCGFDKK